MLWLSISTEQSESLLFFPPPPPHSNSNRHGWEMSVQCAGALYKSSIISVTMVLCTTLHYHCALCWTPEKNDTSSCIEALRAPMSTSYFWQLSNCVYRLYSASTAMLQAAKCGSLGGM